MTDLIGPASAANATTSRKVEGRTFGGADTWFKPCSTPAAQDGTQLQADWLNGVLAQLRNAIRGNGNTAAATPVVVESNADDSLLLKAIQQLVQRGRPLYAVAGGTANAIVLSPAPSLLEYIDGEALNVTFVAANTGAATVNVSGVGVVPLTRVDGTALLAGDIVPGMRGIIRCLGTSWQLLTLSPAAVVNIVATVARLVLTAPLNVWIRPTGNDGNDGSANDDAHAFATIQGAWNAVKRKYELAGQAVNFRLGTPATYAGAVFDNVGVTGTVSLIGDPANQANYIVTPVGSGQFYCVRAEFQTVFVTGLTLDVSSIAGGTAVYGVWAVGPGGQISVNGNVTFKSTTNNAAVQFINIGTGGIVYTAGTITVTGGASPTTIGSVIAVDGGGIFSGSGSVVTNYQLTNLAWTQFISVTNVSIANFNSAATTFSYSTVSGSRYTSYGNAVLNTSGAGATYFPGSTAGTATSGGLYI